MSARQVRGGLQGPGGRAAVRPAPVDGDAPLQTARVESARLVEIHLRAVPDEAPDDFGGQARSMYERLLEGLQAHGAAASDVVAERVFLADVEEQAPRLAAIRDEVLGRRVEGSPRPAFTCAEQPPARPGRHCEVQAVALRGAAGAALATRAIPGLPPWSTGRVVDAGGAHLLFLAGVTGAPRDAASGFLGEALSMFSAADDCLRSEGLSFRDVVRTWIYLADIRRDYAILNGVRRSFFEARGVDPPPASTGIRGRLDAPGRACGLGLVAVAGSPRPRVAPLSAPLMNEAPSYGSHFSRGMRVEFEDRTVLHVSGTASIDARGRVAYPGDIRCQAGRMLLNIESLLARQGADYSHVASAVTYLKRPEYAAAFERVAARRGFPADVPHTRCVADICRPAWLCEMELTAVVPRGR